jgi:hypothetical protein
MGTGENQNQRHRFKPTPGFWIKLGLVINLATPALPSCLALLLALVILALPARLFEA